MFLIIQLYWCIRHKDSNSNSFLIYLQNKQISKVIENWQLRNFSKKTYSFILTIVKVNDITSISFHTYAYQSHFFSNEKHPFLFDLNKRLKNVRGRGAGGGRSAWCHGIDQDISIVKDFFNFGQHTGYCE